MKKRDQPDDEETILVAETFKLLGDPSRLRIALAVMDEPIAVGAIAEQLNLSPSLVSHHLRLLRAARLVRPERDGRTVRYSIHDHHIEHVVKDMLDHIREGDRS